MLELSVQSVTVTSLMQALTRIGIGRVQRPSRPRVHQQVGQTDMMAPLLGPPLAVRMVSMYRPGGICVEELGRRNRRVPPREEGMLLTTCSHSARASKPKEWVWVAVRCSSARLTGVDELYVTEKVAPGLREVGTRPMVGRGRER